MEIKISVPTTLGDITLDQYKRYEKILIANQEAENSERFINLKMVEIFCGITYEQASAMKLVDYQRIVEQVYNVLQETPKLITRFKMGDTEFGFIPNLEEMTFGEYIDLDTYIHDMTQVEKAMAVLYRPIKQKFKDRYLIDEYKGDLFHDAMLNMPMDAVVSSILFFYHLGIDLSNVMMNSLEGKQAVQQAELQDLAKSGVGINPYMDLHREIYGDLKI